MNVNNDTSSYGTTGDSSIATNSNSTGGLNTLFMQLLVAQIKNQDPLNPTSGTEYVSQLAQLTQVQSMETISKLIENNSILMDNLQTLTTGNLVGQNVMVKTDTLTSDGTTVVKGRLTLEHEAGVVTVVAKDSVGKEHKIELGAQKAGQVDFSLDPKALGLAEGKYTLSIVADTGEENVSVELGGAVKNVRIPLDGTATVLDIVGVGEIAYNNITQFGNDSSKA